jgi:MHS family proline/betaine transporter-like MFS transporter
VPRRTRNLTASRAISAAIFGNALEWFDFTVFALFAPFIARAFFPADTEFLSLLKALATFGIGFIPRPLGAIVLGQYADRAGRRAALTLIIVLMSLGAAIIALTPVYARIGVAAPVLIVIGRLLQGFSVGGEMGGATAYLIEQAPPGRRGFYASWQFAGQAGAAVAGSLLALFLTRALTPGELGDWGWRVPFLAGLVIAPVGLYLRSTMTESAEFASRPPDPELAIAGVWRTAKRAVAQSFGITILLTAGTYIILFYMPTYAAKELGFRQDQAFIGATVSSLLYLVFNPVAGLVSDRIGRMRHLRIAGAAFAALVPPLFLLLARHPVMPVLIAVQGALGVLLAMYTGPAASAIGEMFPPRLRATGLSLGYNLAVPIFGGFAPYFVARMHTGDHLAPAWYIFACAIPALASLMLPAGGRRPSAPGVDATPSV